MDQLMIGKWPIYGLYWMKFVVDLHLLLLMCGKKV